MNRLEAVGVIIKSLQGDELIVHANGAINRESYYYNDRKKNFYMLGSMGLASSIGIGLAVSQPEKKVIVLDGDGNIIMGFGNLALVGVLKPPNLLHIVLDNRVYGTTGNQKTISQDLNLSEIASSCGYLSTAAVENQEQLTDVLKEILNNKGPRFLHIKVSKTTPEPVPRIPYSAEEIKNRFLSVTK